MNKRLLESLIRCGAMDGFKENRNQLLHMYESAQAVGAKEQKDAAMGTMSLFGDMDGVCRFHPCSQCGGFIGRR